MSSLTTKVTLPNGYGMPIVGFGTLRDARWRHRGEFRDTRLACWLPSY